MFTICIVQFVCFVCEMVFCCTSFCCWILSAALVYSGMVMFSLHVFFLTFVTCTKSLRSKVTEWLESMLKAVAGS